MKKEFTNEIPIFFATDDNYAPFLVVCLKSMLKNSSKDYFYMIHILCTNICQRNYDELKKFDCENASVEFVDVSQKLDKLGDKLHLRDYYTNTTYYRLFIASLCPEYDKAIYLDCDLVFLGDVSKFFENDISNYYVGAVVEDVMQHYDVFGSYVENALGIERKKFFNAGVLLLNLKKFREENMEERFVALLKEFKFEVTQDEDYLNVLCKDKVLYLDYGWNRAPLPDTDFDAKKLNIVHYKMSLKPWNYADIMYEDAFWNFAKETIYYEEFMQNCQNYSEAQKQKDQRCFERLVQTAMRDIERFDNYKNVTARRARFAENYLSLNLKTILQR